jgi:predicted secreted protein
MMGYRGITSGGMGMRRYLLAALWPAGLGAIAAATVIAARRAPAAPALAVADDPAGPDEAEPDGSAERGRDAVPLAGVPDLAPARPAVARDVIRLGAISCAGGVAAYGVMRLLGPPIVNHGLTIDEPIFRWTTGHQVKGWAAVMERFNKIGNTWTIWGAAGAAAACLGVAWPRQKWLPPSVLGAAVVVDHYATLALRHKFHRVGPPTSPLGTYPSGGCDRVVLFYGLIAHMLWREFSGSYRGKVWAAGTVAALSFNVAYCRQYLSKHWFSDIVLGLFYGLLLLAPFTAAIRLIAGPAAAGTGRETTVLPALIAAYRAAAGVPRRAAAVSAARAG